MHYKIISASLNADVPFLQLPAEILALIIILGLDNGSLMKLACCCRFLRDFCRDPHLRSSLETSYKSDPQHIKTILSRFAIRVLDYSEGIPKTENGNVITRHMLSAADMISLLQNSPSRFFLFFPPRHLKPKLALTDLQILAQQHPALTMIRLRKTNFTPAPTGSATEFPKSMIITKLDKILTYTAENELRANRFFVASAKTTDSELKTQLSKNRDILFLDLSQAQKLTDTGAEMIATCLPHLKALYLPRASSGFSESAIIRLAGSLKHLKALSLGKNALTPALYEELKKARPPLRLLRFYAVSREHEEGIQRLFRDIRQDFPALRYFHPGRILITKEIYAHLVTTTPVVSFLKVPRFK